MILSKNYADPQETLDHGPRRRLLAFACAAAAAALFAFPAHSSASNRNRIYKQLAHRIVTGSSGRATSALEKALDKIGIPVINAAGKRLTPDARPARDFHVYDFDLQALVAKAQSGKTFTADELASIIKGLRSKGTVPSASELAKRLSKAARASARRDSRRLDLIRLVAAIGRERHNDPAHVSAQDLKLDPVQLALLLLGQYSEQAASGTHTSRAPGQANLSPAMRSGSTRCVGAHFERQFKGAKGVENDLGMPDLIGEGADVVHGMTIAVNTDVHASPFSVTDTDYGPRRDSHLSAKAGRYLRFEVIAKNTVHYSADYVRCGELAGLKLPSDGPIKGAPVDWAGLYGSDYETLLRYGTVVREDKETSADGSALLIVQPNNELLPGVGAYRQAHGHIRPAVDVASGAGNHLVSDALKLFSLYGETGAPTYNWTVGFHQPSLRLRYAERVSGDADDGESSSLEDWNFASDFPLELNSQQHRFYGHGPIDSSGYDVVLKSPCSKPGGGEVPYGSVDKQTYEGPGLLNSSVEVVAPNGWDDPARQLVLRLMQGPGVQATDSWTNACGGPSSTIVNDAPQYSDFFDFHVQVLGDYKKDPLGNYTPTLDFPMTDGNTIIAHLSVAGNEPLPIAGGFLHLSESYDLIEAGS